VGESGRPGVPRNADFGSLLEAVLLAAVATILVIRTQLYLTHYPQLGGGRLQIAHLRSLSSGSGSCACTRAREAACRWIDRAVLVSVFVTRVFAFVESRSARSSAWPSTSSSSR
jgi:hypothetical protein